MLEALEAQDETLVLGMAFEERLRLVVDEAHSGFNHAKVEGPIRRAGLRYRARICTGSTSWTRRLAPAARLRGSR
ncbi:hypothetical protein [Arthrobacter sp. DR-2P]|uniref:hypothetical protein n=1 Tax=Arthrobacter sp. DR-2P TaxID=2507588 RepID=UPI00211DBD18|nr:hypothetical protein [Arthrobacter sp. DR-2P]